jgi:hypothetical protein
MSRIYPWDDLCEWEALPHVVDAFIIGLPSFDDLQRVNGI